MYISFVAVVVRVWVCVCYCMMNVWSAYRSGRKWLGLLFESCIMWMRAVAQATALQDDCYAGLLLWPETLGVTNGPAR